MSRAKYAIAATVAVAMIPAMAGHSLAAGEASSSASFEQLTNPFSTLNFSRFTSGRFGLPVFNFDPVPTPIVVPSVTVEGAEILPAAATSRPPFRPRVRSPFRPPIRPPF